MKEERFDRTALWTIIVIIFIMGILMVTGKWYKLNDAFDKWREPEKELCLESHR